MNYAVWESVDHFRAAFTYPDFVSALAAYPSSARRAAAPFRQDRGAEPLRGLTGPHPALVARATRLNTDADPGLLLCPESVGKGSTHPEHQEVLVGQERMLSRPSA